MTRGTYVWDPIAKAVVEKGKQRAAPPAKRAAVKALACRNVARGRFYWNGKDWVPYAPHAAGGKGRGLQVVRDIEPYRSVITGERVGGRRQHRDHLRAHGCVEVGNDMPTSKTPAVDRESIRQDLKRAVEVGMMPEVKHAVERANKAAGRDRVWH